MASINLSIAALLEAYQSGRLQPKQVIEHILDKCQSYADYNIWIGLLDRQSLEDYCQRLPKHFDPRLPLYGIPFSIKDNIDLAGVESTAACKAYAYSATQSAYVVEKLIQAGAIPVGKTNLDQFATGLVGTRSDYGVCANAFDREFIAGGSSSGSALSVALGLSSFSLGTDTAGSGRVPAAFNNLVGVKPSKGWLSTRGVIPACRSLDCVSIFALNTDDANTVLQQAQGYDENDPYARENPVTNDNSAYGDSTDSFRFGVLSETQFPPFQNAEYSQRYAKFCNQLQALGGEKQVIDYQPFIDAAKLLYDGPWLAERYVAIKSFIDKHADAMQAETRKIISAGESLKTADAFSAFYQLQVCKKRADTELADLDFTVLPGAPDHYRIQQVQQSPIELNTRLGYYTNFMNLLDYSALALPAGFCGNGLPFGITLFSGAFNDRRLLSFGRRVQRAQSAEQGSSRLMGNTGFALQLAERGSAHSGETVDLVVCGAHLSGFPLNHQLTSRSATLLRADQTAAKYRFYALAGEPKRPGLIRDETAGAAIAVEVWRMPVQQLGSFVAAIPEPLGIGKVQLSDDQFYTGFICEPYAINQAEEITHFGSWAAYIKQ